MPVPEGKATACALPRVASLNVLAVSCAVATELTDVLGVADMDDCSRARLSRLARLLKEMNAGMAS